MKLHDLTIHELRDMLSRGQVSSREITEAFLSRIDETEPSVRGYITVSRDQAIADADAADAALARARRDEAGDSVGALLGIPVAIKDNICTKGIRTTCASKMLEDFVPPYDATVVSRLRDAGAVIIGKANLDEFAMGSSTETSFFHVTRNPWDLDRVPGGSSGGSAAVVAAGEAAAAIGTDTGGSVRQPASFCGVVGMKPSYGRVSRYGAVAFASSLDGVGPITRDVEDCALAMNVIAGVDELDCASAPQSVPDYTERLNRGVKGMTIGVPKEFFGAGLDTGVREVVERTIDVLAKAGAAIREVSLPNLEYALATYYILATGEASSNLARFDGIRYGYRASGCDDVGTLMKRTRSEGFGTEVKRRIMLGTFALSSGRYDEYYLKALKVRNVISQDLSKALAECDLLISPTSPAPAFKFGEKAEDPLSMYLVDVYTTIANLAGIPAASVPGGFAGGLPVGVQLMGRWFGEGTILQAAHFIEQTAGVAGLRPAGLERAADSACHSGRGNCPGEGGRQSEH